MKKLVHGSTKLRFGELDGFSSENAAVYQDGWENVRLVLRSLQSSDNEVFTKDTIAYKALRVLFRHRTAKDGLGKTFKEITRVNVVYGHMLGVHGQLFSEKHGALLLRRSYASGGERLGRHLKAQYHILGNACRRGIKLSQLLLAKGIQFQSQVIELD